MKNVHNLGGFAALGVTRTITLQPIPDIGARGRNVHLTHLCIEMRMDITTIAGGAVTVRQLYAYLASLTLTILGRPVVSSMSGWDLRTLLGPGVFQQSTLAADPAVIGAGVANAIRTVRLYIPFNDPTLPDPGEGALPAKLLNEASQVAIATGAPAAIGVNATVNACEITFWGLTEDRDDMGIPSLPMYGSADVNRFSTLPGGLYEACVLVEPVAHFAAADVTVISARGDEGAIHNAIATDGVIAAFVAQRAAQNWPDAVAFRDTPASFPFIPIIYPELIQGTRMSRLVPALRGLQLDIQGAAATVHAVWIRREPSPRVATDALRALGASDPSGFELLPQDGPNGTKPSFVAAEREYFLGRLKVAHVLSVNAAGGLAGRIKLKPMVPQMSAKTAGLKAAAQRFRASAGQLGTGGPGALSDNAASSDPVGVTFWRVSR